MLSQDDVELAVSDLMGLMEPSYLEGKTHGAESMRRVLFSASLMIAAASGEITPEEIAALESLLDFGNVPQEPDLDTIRRQFPKRVEQLKALEGRARRAQVVRDLAVIAKADGKVQADEVQVMYEVADALEVDRSVVDRAIERKEELD